MVSLAFGAAIGAVVGAVALGAAAAAHGDIPGLAVALQHLPPDTHGHAVVSAVKSALAGGGIGAAVSAVAKGAAGAVAR